MYCNKLKVYIIKNYQAMNGSSSNPSDYQFLLRTLTEGNHVARAQSLKRFNTLILSDKKQFSNYAKRIVIAIQDLMVEQRQDINLLACTLALEVINLNPRDIEFYVKNKLLKSMVINLGDTKPQIRKTSHYCLLAFIRTFKNFDDLIEAYIMNGIMSKEWQLRQKSINSFQSILVMEMRYVDWTSSQFKRIFQLLLTKLKDQNGFVQKASEQCLLSLSKVQEIRSFSKRLSPICYNILKGFCEQQFQIGNLHQIKIQSNQKKVQSERYNQNLILTSKYGQNNFENGNSQKQDQFRSEQKNEVKAIAGNSMQGGQQSYRRKPERNSMKKAQSTMGSHHPKQLHYSVNLKQVRNPERQDKDLKRQSSLLLPPISNINPPQTNRLQKIEQIVGKKLIQDLRNDKDWKVRLQAIEELQTKFQVSRQQFEIDVLMKNLVPILIKLLGDSNFKVALVALKIIQQILRMPQISLELIVPQIVDKLSDNKVALRQNISKLIKGEYALSKQSIWLDNLLLHIKKTSNSNIKEQVLNILYKIYEEGNVPYSYEKILELICPLMDDLKTKIKIKTLDLLAIVTIKSQKVDRAKNLLASKMNQVYYEMYLQKIGKELKSFREANPNYQKQNNIQKQKPMRTSMNHLSRKANKIGNTTSTSLQRYASGSQAEPNSTVKTAFYQLPKQDEKVDTINSKQDVEHYQAKIPQLSHIDNLSVTDDEISQVKKTTSIARHLRRRGPKSIESRLSTTNYSNDDAFPPFHDPQRQLKNILIELKSDDWQISNEALNKMRRVLYHHGQLLVSSVTKLIVPDIIRLSESLRSTLSKSALIVIYELSNKVKKQLDSEFDLMFSKLIKKSLDTNTFISEQVKKALVTVCSNCNEAKVINSLNNSHISRAIPIKIAVVNILEGITFLPKFYEKELEKVVAILNDFMNQGSLQIREKTKNLLNNILASQKGPSIVKLIPNQHKNKLKKIQQLTSSISKSQVRLEASFHQQKQSVIAEKQPDDIYPRKKKKNKITNFPQQFQDLDGYLQHCESSDWKIRLQNMNLISQIITKYTQEILQHRSSSRIIDVLSKQINDPNVKVASNALKIFEDLTSKIPTLIESSLSVIMNEIFICFSSSKVQVKILAEQLFDSISQHVEKWMLTQHMCNGVLYSIQKSKPTILHKLSQLVPEIYKAKPNIFQKNVYSMINKVAEQNKPQMIGPLKELLQVLYTQIGQDCLSYLKQKAKQLIIQ